MTALEHYREAERLLAEAAEAADWEPNFAKAQVHATLALAAERLGDPDKPRPATVYTGSSTRRHR